MRPASLGRSSWSEPARADVAPANKKVLIVEDDPEFRAAITEIIVLEGYEVEAATSGMEALDKLRWGLRPRLILLDLQMRVMTGWEFRAEQRRTPALAAIPVVAMTAGYWKGPEFQDFNACIAKPIDLAELQAILQGY